MQAATAHTYETEVVWTGAREGELHSTGLPPLEVTAPPELGGHPGMWTPEHYLVAAVSTCLMTTVIAVADASHLPIVAFRCTGWGTLEETGGPGMEITQVVLEPHLTLADPSQREQAIRVLEKAERNCFISRSIKAHVKLLPTIEIASRRAAA